MSLTSEQSAELAALRTARAALITGQRVAKVTKGDRTVEYSPADIDRIDARIAELESLAAGAPRRRAMIFRL